jgi:hypothetical protein
VRSDADRRAEHEQFRRIDAAFRAGDLEKLRAAVPEPERFPNGTMPLAVGPCLEYAIYHSPLRFPRLRTRVDELETPRELAERRGLRELAQLLAAGEARLRR